MPSIRSTVIATGWKMHGHPDMQIPFYDFSRETSEIGSSIHAALERVMSSGVFIMGNELKSFEKCFAESCNCTYGVGVATGTDALFLALTAMGIGKGDEVITVSNTFAATVLAVLYTGATPVLVDIEGASHLIDAARVERAVTERTKAIIPVHLFGACAEMDKITEIARSRGLFVLEDACQAHGALYKGRPAGSLGDAAAFSFYPTKNLGAYGDGGMVTTNRRDLYEKLLLLRNYGQKDRYQHMLIGYNSRLDEIQAAFLREKLPRLKEWVDRRQKAAQAYDRGIGRINLIKPDLAEGSTHAYYLYVLSVEDRDCLREHLSSRGIQTLIHYPVPIHKQEAFKSLRIQGDLSNTERRSTQIVSLPLHPWIREDEIAYVIESIREHYR